MHSRSKDIPLQDYENLIGKSFIETPIGVRHKEIMQNLLLNSHGSCIVPFVDLVNNYIPKFDRVNKEDYKEDPPVQFSLLYDKNGAKFFIPKEFKKGEEYSYSYFNYQINENFLRKTGCYFDEENYPDSDMKTVLLYRIRKGLLSEQKYMICSILQCLDSNIDEFYQNKNKNHIDIYLKFNSYQLNERFLNLIKLENTSDDFLSVNENAIDFTKKLLSKKWLSYDKEMVSLAYYRKTFYDTLEKIHMKIVKRFF